MTLQELLIKQLDETRVKLIINLYALDDDLPETFKNACNELDKLQKIINHFNKSIREIKNGRM